MDKKRTLGTFITRESEQYCVPEADILVIQEQEAILQISGLHENEISPWDI